MERRIAKLIVGKAGGTAGKDSKTYKVSLPSKWIAELDLTDFKMEIAFDGERIVISPHLSMEKFIENKKTLSILTTDQARRPNSYSKPLFQHVLKSGFGRKGRYLSTNCLVTAGTDSSRKSPPQSYFDSTCILSKQMQMPTVITSG